MFAFTLTDTAVNRNSIRVTPETTVGDLVAWFSQTPGFDADLSLRWAGRVLQAAIFKDETALVRLVTAGYALTDLTAA
jgi:hypothetical protein